MYEIPCGMKRELTEIKEALMYSDPNSSGISVSGTLDSSSDIKNIITLFVCNISTYMGIHS